MSFHGHDDCDWRSERCVEQSYTADTGGDVAVKAVVKAKAPFCEGKDRSLKGSSYVGRYVRGT